MGSWAPATPGCSAAPRQRARRRHEGPGPFSPRESSPAGSLSPKRSLSGLEGLPLGVQRSTFLELQRQGAYLWRRGHALLSTTCTWLVEWHTGGGRKKHGFTNCPAQAPRRVSQFSSGFPGALNTPGVTELVSLLPRRATALAVCCRPPSVSFQEVSAATFAKLLSPRRGCQLHFSSFAPNQTKPRRDAHL